MLVSIRFFTRAADLAHWERSYNLRPFGRISAADSFQVVLVPMNYQKSARVMEVTDRLYEEFNSAGIYVR
jgi:hypothetical protein